MCAVCGVRLNACVRVGREEAPNDRGSVVPGSVECLVELLGVAQANAIAGKLDHSLHALLPFAQDDLKVSTVSASTCVLILCEHQRLAKGKSTQTPLVRELSVIGGARRCVCVCLCVCACVCLTTCPVLLCALSTSASCLCSASGWTCKLIDVGCANTRTSASVQTQRCCEQRRAQHHLLDLAATGRSSRATQSRQARHVDVGRMTPLCASVITRARVCVQQDDARMYARLGASVLTAVADSPLTYHTRRPQVRDLRCVCAHLHVPARSTTSRRKCSCPQ
jgi:hypothetical protein